MQFLLGVADAGNIGQSVLGEQPVCLFVGHHVNQRQSDTGRFDFFSAIGKLGQCLAAKGTTAVTKEDD